MSQSEEGNGVPVRLLALHGFRTSGSILKSQLDFSGFTQDLKGLVHFYPLDAPHPAVGPPESIVQKVFEGPFYEWWNAVEDPPGVWTYNGWEKTLGAVTEYVQSNGPFDGILGFSQGAALAATLVGMQQNGHAMQNIPPFEICVCISGVDPRSQLGDLAFSKPITCKSLHVIGAKDPIHKSSERLTERFVSPTIIRHDGGHVVPRLEQHALITMKGFFSRIRGKC